MPHVKALRRDMLNGIDMRPDGVYEVPECVAKRAEEKGTAVRVGSWPGYETNVAHSGIVLRKVYRNE